MDEFHKGDVGARLIITIKEQGVAWSAVQNATTKTIKWAPKTTGITQEFAANFAQAPEGAGDGSDGKLEYITTSTSDLPETGTYEVQAYLVIPSVWTGHTQKGFMTVKPTL